MKNALFAFSFLLALLLPGCAVNKPKIEIPTVVQADEAPVPKSGYVAATVLATSKQAPGGIALGLVNTTTYAEHLLPIGNLGYLESYKDLNNIPRVIALPPGQYRLAFWVTYYYDNGELLTKNTIQTNSPMAITFSVAPDGITYLGSYSTMSEHKFKGNEQTTHWRVNQDQIPEHDARQAVFARHPTFSKLDFFCPRCIAVPVPGNRSN